MCPPSLGTSAGQRSEPLSPRSASPAGTARAVAPAGTGCRPGHSTCAMAALVWPAVTMVLLCLAVHLEASPELSGLVSENTLHTSHSPGVHETGSHGQFGGRNAKKQISSQSLSFAEHLPQPRCWAEAAPGPWTELVAVPQLEPLMSWCAARCPATRQSKDQRLSPGP